MDSIPTTAPTKPGANDASARSTSTAALTKRLQQELSALMMSGGETGISAFPAEDSLFQWKGTVTGPSGTAYEDLTFRLSLAFTSEYPFQAPTVKFETPCFHPNVDLQGNICLDILKEKWTAAYSVRTILQSIQSLLGDANVDSPLNVQAAKMWGMNDVEYRNMVLTTFNSKK